MAEHKWNLKQGRVENNTPSPPLVCLIPIGLPWIKSSDLLPELSLPWMGLPMPLAPCSEHEGGLEGYLKLAFHVVSSS